MTVTSLLVRSALLTATLLAGTSASGFAPKAKSRDIDPEGARVIVPDVVQDKAPVVETAADVAMLPDWTIEQATALLTAIEASGAEALFPADYAPGALAVAITQGQGPALNQAATNSFLLLATHLRDGRTPNAARRQWFMVDSDDKSMPLMPLLASALSSGDIAGALSGLNPEHPDFAALRDALGLAKDKATADRIRVNMERWRWMPRALGPRYIFTNVPEYMTRVVHADKVIAAHKAVVGKVTTATPQLNVLATGIILNPTWTLPRSIINEGIGATIASRPAVARAQGYTWTGKGPTLSVVQSAGPGNALGMMKLEMLNEHAIYLHDTPSKGAFAAAERAFSHGCIRTERALHFSGLMSVLFAGRTAEEFGEAYASGKTTRFGFDDPFPVYIGYQTMARDAAGKLVSFKDLYGRDAPVIASFARPGRPAAAVLAAAQPAVPAPTGR